MIHGHQNIKFTNAQQAQPIYKYGNTKEKLHKTNAAIWFNKTCKYKQLTPKYIAIKIKGNNPRNHKTIKVATQYRLKQELKFLYKSVDPQLATSQIGRAHV
jgi:hypothetical protein